MDIRIKYFEGASELEEIKIGDWIDCYSREDVIIPKNEFALVKLGFAMEIPEGYEGHLAPRSSTFKKWGVIQTNSVGVIDNSYKGDNDEWMMPCYCLIPNDPKNDRTVIKKGDKICQFRITKTMKEECGEINFVKVDKLGNPDRNGFGSTGTTKGAK